MATISGVSTMVAIVPVCPPASVPCAISRSAPASICRSACRACPTSAATTTPATLARVTRPGGGVPSALATSEIRWLNATSSSASAPPGFSPATIPLLSARAAASGMPYWSSRPRTKARCCSGICARRLAIRSSGSPGTNFSGTSRSTPYGLPPVCSSIQVSWASSSSGVYAEAASTPRPPALVTAATTPGERLNPAIGCGTPTRSVKAVRIRALYRGCVPGLGQGRTGPARSGPAGQPPAVPRVACTARYTIRA